MKYTFFACLISLVLSTQFYSSPESTNIDLKIPEKETSNKAIIGDLYPILENELWGYMNAKGETVIQPQFHSIGQFSEGLAPARLKGTYGFIDHTGDFVIPAQYDMAYSFYKGMAKVYLDTIPYFIDNQGEILFKHNFKEINTFNKYGTSIVKTYQDYYGVINQNGKLIVDTIYEEVTEFSDRLAVVTGTKHNPYPDSEEQKPIYEKGVVDLEGNFVVPFGRYKDISDFVNGLARVRMIKEKQQDKNKNIEEGVMDENGTLRFTIPDKKWHFDYRYEHFSEDVAVVEIYLVDRDTIKSWSSNDRHTFKGVINTDGKILFSNRSWDEITPFKMGRAFVQDVNKNWFLINKKGETLNKIPYKDILFDTYRPVPQYLFQDEKAFVETDEGWGAIDTTGKFVIQPRKFDFQYTDFYRRGSIVFFSEDISVQNDDYPYQYGFWNTSKNIFLKPQFHDIQFNDFSQDLTYTVVDGQIGYIDHHGNFIWQQKEDKDSKNKTFNIDYMNRGYFYAASPKKKELMGLGGWGGTDNIFKKIRKSKKFDKNEPSLYINPNEAANFWETHKGIKLYLANTSKNTFYFEAQDSRLNLNIQAQDKNGNWRDIEYLPSSWCGNSYHTLFLPPKNYWEFVVPIYEGEFLTKMRAKLLYKTSTEQRDETILFSNEFEGSINPGQFWNKMPYAPKGLMDPYND